MAEQLRPQDRLEWRVRGLPYNPFRDIYPNLMGASWTATIVAAFAAYLGTSLGFAALFALEPQGIRGAESQADLLWFSVQTLSTIGYGGMTPITPWANLLVIVESFVGLAGVAVVTAILYAKFSLPQARVQFASVLAVHDYEGVPTLHLRLVNERTSPILDAELQVGALVDESNGDRRFRRLHDVELVRNRIPLFAMAFTAMHRLDGTSPLARLVDRDQLQFLVVTLQGTDSRTLQPVFTRAIFEQDQVRFGMGFADMMSIEDDGIRTVDLTKLDALEPMPLTSARSAD